MPPLRTKRYPDTPMMVEPLVGAQVMDMGLSEMAGWWIKARCECGYISQYYPIKLMAGQFGWNVLLSEIVMRMRCTKCRAQPINISLIDRPDRRPGVKCQASNTTNLIELDLTPYPWRSKG